MTFLSPIYFPKNKGFAGCRAVTIIDDRYSLADGLRDGSGSPECSRRRNEDYKRTALTTAE